MHAFNMSAACGTNFKKFCPIVTFMHRGTQLGLVTTRSMRDILVSVSHLI